MSQRKQEIQKNELADSLDSVWEKLKPHKTLLTLVGAAVILLTVTITMWFYWSQTTAEAQWENFLASTRFADTRGMEEVAKAYPNTAAGNFASIRVADDDLTRGASTIVTDRTLFNERVQRAVKRYETLANDTNADAFIRRRALYGLGYSYEMLGQFAQARESYQQLQDSAPDEPISVLARQGLERLSNDSVVGIWEKFKAWQPEESSPTTDPLLPNRPDITFPSGTAVDQAAETSESDSTSEQDAEDADAAGTQDDAASQEGGAPSGEESSSSDPAPDAETDADDDSDGDDSDGDAEEEGDGN